MRRSDAVGRRRPDNHVVDIDALTAGDAVDNARLLDGVLSTAEVVELGIVSAAAGQGVGTALHCQDVVACADVQAVGGCVSG